jgi:hypothetical protein
MAERGALWLACADGSALQVLAARIEGASQALDAAQFASRFTLSAVAADA